jgi:hypothetical protein
VGEVAHPADVRERRNLRDRRIVGTYDVGEVAVELAGLAPDPADAA